MTAKKSFKPPRIAQWLLTRLVDPSIFNFAMGDFEEQFNYLTHTKGLFFARLNYWAQVVVVLPTFLQNIVYWSCIMINNYLKICFRGIKKHKIHSFINIVGLAVGLACSILLFLWAQEVW